MYLVIWPQFFGQWDNQALAFYQIQITVVIKHQKIIIGNHFINANNLITIFINKMTSFFIFKLISKTKCQKKKLNNL